ILDSKRFSTSMQDSDFIVDDSETDAVTGIAFVTKPHTMSARNAGGVAKWQLNIKAGETTTIRYFITYADSESVVTGNISKWRNSFGARNGDVKNIWDKLWLEIFKPHNDLLSGSFPVLETEDTIITRVYYTGPLTMLYLMNTNLPQHKRVILTGGPKWGATISFFWDNTEWSLMQAVADPGQMKESLRSWIKV